MPNITDAEYTVVSEPRRVPPTGWQQFRYVAFRLFQVAVWMFVLVGLADTFTSGRIVGWFAPELSPPYYHPPKLSDPVALAHTAAPPSR